MIDFAINIEPLYPGMDICEKIARVGAAGIHAVEFWSWDDRDLAQIKNTCREHGVKVRAFSATKSYSLCDGEHSKEYLDWIRQSVGAAKELDCDTLILFPNHFTPEGCSDFRNKYSHEAMIANITHNLTCMVPMLEENKITVLLEPLCSVGSDAGMSVTDTSVGADIVRAVNSRHVKLLCDVFHMQMMHGNLLQNITENLDIVPYIHIADAPDRHEPGTGEINFDFLFRKIKESDFDGTVCFEYFPEGDTEAGFAAVRKCCEI
ncbi:TIM barrel protein [Ruminococcus sp. OA3]|uniref:TIM barrel protein n=1 Tax=Ruminococcus sp. OA3 TaxID=2914164 RepID=UPI001F06AE6A|nr:TIM barrel protein [Ruminococcus sp. OA3]MCH1981205.1 TIM barrel protein [Ruminococcus sp. OA3]